MNLKEVGWYETPDLGILGTTGYTRGGAASMTAKHQVPGGGAFFDKEKIFSRRREGEKKSCGKIFFLSKECSGSFSMPFNLWCL